MGKAERIEIEDFVQNIVERMETPEAFEKMISREEECEAQGQESRLRDVLKKEWPVDEKGERIYQITNTSCAIRASRSPCPRYQLGWNSTIRGDRILQKLEFRIECDEDEDDEFYLEDLIGFAVTCTEAGADGAKGAAAFTGSVTDYYDSVF